MFETKYDLLNNYKQDMGSHEKRSAKFGQTGNSPLNESKN